MILKINQIQKALKICSLLWKNYDKQKKLCAIKTLKNILLSSVRNLSIKQYNIV